MTEETQDVAVPSPQDAKERLEQALFEIRRVIAGQDAMLERVLVCLLAHGHLLIEGVPGLAKTLTIKTTAGVLGGTFSRIQFTPDLVPSDLVGTRVYRRRGTFETELGPVFCNFLLADEINRAPAKVQSALLEVMQEHQVTIGHDDVPGAGPVPRDGDAEPDRVRGHLPAAGGPGRPLHAQGRHRLPRARRGADDRAPAARGAARAPARRCPSTTSGLQRAVFEIYVDPALVSYAVALATATREPAAHGLAEIAPYIAYGASPRGPISLVQAARALALIRGRDYVLAEDLHALAQDALRHRLVLTYQALAEEVSPDTILDQVIAAVPVPQIDLASTPSAASAA